MQCVMTVVLHFLLSMTLNRKPELFAVKILVGHVYTPELSYRVPSAA